MLHVGSHERTRGRRPLLQVRRYHSYREAIGYDFTTSKGRILHFTFRGSAISDETGRGGGDVASIVQRMSCVR